MTEHEEHRQALGSYLLGALDPAGRSELEGHLAHCAECRAELASFAGLPALLSRLTIEEARGEAAALPVSLLPKVVRSVERDRRRARRRLRAWQGAAVVAALSAAAAIAGPLVLAQAPPPVGRFTAAPGVTASGVLAADAKPWGTELHMTVRLPAAAAYIAYAVGPGGTRRVAATWGRTPSGRMSVDGATDLTLTRLESVEITTVAGAPLLHLDHIPDPGA